MNKQKILISNSLSTDLLHALQLKPYDKLFVLTDEETYKYCLPKLQKALQDIKNIIYIQIKHSDLNKTLESLAHVWSELSNNGASRSSLLLNLGGGMVTDLGGFAASTFKRGIRYINIPTTLLSMVDAAIGGKTGVNFNGLKNEIGVFNPAFAVLLDTNFLETLDHENLTSGYAEMLKHGLISKESHWAELLLFNLHEPNFTLLKKLVAESVQVKEQIVAEDPYEHGIRKALNLGHTVGHAFESLSFELGTPVLHGYAVAWGIVCELYLSAAKTNFPQEKMRQTIQFIAENWGCFPLHCKQYDRLYELMTHDKKNTSGIINFTLLSDIGGIVLNQTATKEEINQMFDFYQECSGL